MRLALDGGCEQFAGHDHEGAWIALGMVAQCRDHLGGHQCRGAGLLEGMAQAILEVLRGCSFDGQPYPDAAGEREEFVRAQAFGKPSVAGQHDGQQDAGIEIGAGAVRRAREVASLAPRR